MSAEEFREIGYRLVDWLCEYRERLEELPATGQVPPGWLTDRLPEAAPTSGEPWDAIIGDLDELIVPALTNWQSPNFFAYFPANTSGPSILGELLSAGLGVQGMLWATSPAATELETHLLDQLRVELGLPNRYSTQSTGGGVIQDSASSATLVAIIAARERARSLGVALDAQRVILSSATHSSGLKGARVAGYLDDQIVHVGTDSQGAMDMAALDDALGHITAHHAAASIVIGTIGTTATGAVDPIDEIADRLDPDTWLHVDAAYAGVAGLCPEYRPLLAGVDRADSFCTNAHKWLLTNFDCSLMWVADRRAITSALSVTPSYLANEATDSGAVIDYRDWMVPLGRRFRALKLWLVVRRFGMDGLRSHLRHHSALAAEFGTRVANDPHLEVVGQPILGLVCLRHRSGDEATQELHRQLTAGGTYALTLTQHDGRSVLRVAIGATLTRARHVDALWAALEAHAAAL
jgi:aromatic-L-amino-acid decarboxylase